MSMKDVEPIRELYLGCECMDLDHVAHLGYFPPTEKEKEDGEIEVIYFRIKFKSYFDRFFPPIRYFYEKYEWESFFYYNYIKKIGIGLKSIFDKEYVRIGGILSCFDFQNKDLSKLDIFLSQITEKIDEKDIDDQSLTLLDNERWLVYFSIDKEFHKENYPYVLGWDQQFVPFRNIFGRIKYALKYIFGKYSDEQEFDIKEREAAKLRGMIKWIENKNKEEKEEEKKNV